MDVVINIPAVKNGNWAFIENEIDGYTTAVKLKRGKILKLILETAYLNEEELEVLGQHGFVVSERYGHHSYTESYYQIFIRDRPVFVSLDSVLHAWNQGYRSQFRHKY